MESLASPEPFRAEETPEVTGEVPRWGLAKRMLFRFAFVYLVLYILPFPLNVLAFFDSGFRWYDNLWNAVLPWVGKSVFHVDVTVLPNGSGDTTYNYVQIFCFLAIALVAALVWTLLDRRRTSYPRLDEYLRVYVRFALATAMIGYGAIKVIQSQFPAPSIDRLLEPFGESSPMGLLWTFMGASRSYNVFTGLSEMLGGLLLAFRRTTLLGALVSAGVLANVVMLNFSYDVPVKIYSLHLLAMAVFLTLPDLRRLANFFLFHRAMEPVGIGPLFQERWLHRAALVLRAVFVAGFTVFVLVGAWRNHQLFADRAKTTPLYGLWEVDEFEADGIVRPPLVTDTLRWRRLIFDYPRVLVIQSMDGAHRRYILDLKAAQREIALRKRDDPKWRSAISYRRPRPDLLAMEGLFGDRRIRVRLHRVDDLEFLLTSRGFHWINEYPFSR